MTSRRTFMTLVGGAAAWPAMTQAQQSGKLPIIGFLGPSTPAAMSDRTAAFVQRLHELGWIEGHTVSIEYRWADGARERFGKIATEFVQLKVDVIVTAASSPVLAVKQATEFTPIVFAMAADPIGNGLVASLARPGGNITGLSNQATDLSGKRLELLREVTPNLSRLAILANINSPAAALEMREVQATALALGFTVVPLEIRLMEEIGPTFEELNRRADAIYVCTDPVVNTNRTHINNLALAVRLPTIYLGKEYVETGGLMSYGPNLPDLFRRAAEYVDKILRGTKPSDIPVEQPTKFELVINLKTAKALGLTIPPTLLARADEVIE